MIDSNARTLGRVESRARKFDLGLLATLEPTESGRYRVQAVRKGFSPFVDSCARLIEPAAARLGP